MTADTRSLLVLMASIVLLGPVAVLAGYLLHDIVALVV